jgi:hypothetical protein
MRDYRDRPLEASNAAPPWRGRQRASTAPSFAFGIRNFWNYIDKT